MRGGFIVEINNDILIEEKIDVLFRAIEKTADFWDDDAAKLYRDKMKLIEIEIKKTLKGK